jgi:Protein of unknown function (DUF5674)
MHAQHHRQIKVAGQKSRIANWTPFNQSIDYESIINIRPSQNNRSMIIQDPAIKERVKRITEDLIGGYEIEFR